MVKRIALSPLMINTGYRNATSPMSVSPRTPRKRTKADQKLRKNYKRARSIVTVKTKRKKKTTKSFLPNAKRTKFTKKVEKVLNGNEPVAVVSRTSYQQLRQVTTDRISYYNLDKQFYPWVYGSGAQILHDASIAFNNKPLSNNISSTTGNLTSDETKINVIDHKLSMFFKSTSNHVVNIEIYECRSKNNQNDEPQEESGESFADVKQRASNLSGPTTIANLFGCSSDMFVELHQHYKVKVHRLKLLPGESTSKMFSVSGQKTYDLSKMMDNGVLWAYPKGCLAFFFRVLNDPTVSGTTGDIHHWSSNQQGGIAARFHMKIRLRAPLNAATDNKVNGVYVHDAHGEIGLSTDQQVAEQNPISLITTPI